MGKHKFRKGSVLALLKLQFEGEEVPQNANKIKELFQEVSVF